VAALGNRCGAVFRSSTLHDSHGARVNLKRPRSASAVARFHVPASPFMTTLYSTATLASAVPLVTDTSSCLMMWCLSSKPSANDGRTQITSTTIGNAAATSITQRDEPTAPSPHAPSTFSSLTASLLTKRGWHSRTVTPGRPGGSAHRSPNRTRSEETTRRDTVLHASRSRPTSTSTTTSSQNTRGSTSSGMPPSTNSSSVDSA
jgi:hypothetical protein